MTVVTFLSFVLDSRLWPLLLLMVDKGGSPHFRVNKVWAVYL